jgi:Major Facilitator Superfamily.
MFGNMTLSFALAYYVLDITKSETIFGLALSATYVSFFLMIPIGGIMADRLKKQRIMFWIDLSTTILIVVYLLISGFIISSIAIVFVKLLMINAIQAIYVTTTQAAIPLIVIEEKLSSGNALMSMIDPLVTAGGQAMAAFMYVRFGVYPILILFAIIYGGMAILDLFIDIPYKKQKSESSILQTINNDMLQAIRFILKDKPIFMKIMIIMFAVNVSVISLLLIGILVLITSTLKLDLNMVGISQFFIAIGALLGGILASLLGAKLTIRKCSLLLIILSFLPIPMGLVIIFDVTAILAFVVITVAGTLAMLVNTLILVALQTFFQSETPPEIFGKVIGIIFTLPFLAQAVGQFGLGVIFEEFGNWPWLSIFISVIITVGAALYSINVFRKYK